VTGVQFDVRNELRPGDLSQTGRRQLLHDLGDLGLVISSIQYPTRRGFADQDELEARVAGCREAMSFAYELKARVVTIRAGRVPEKDDAPEAAILRDVLTDLARHANNVGVSLAVTPSRDQAERLSAFLGSITTGPIGVNFDPAAFILAGQSPDAAFRTLHKLVLHFTVRDAVRDVDGGGVETAVGRGEVAWDEMLALLQESDYRGWMVIDRTQGDDKPRDALRAVKYLQNVLFH
jgi:sugar phosphate isomerase/epimerase